jgi:dephospho-CoA kinase
MGSGKSTVAELLVAFGAELIDFDELARFVLSPRSEGWTKVVELFGPKIVLKDDNLDRPKIASLVFKNPSALKALEDIIHPLAWRLMLDRLNELKDSPMVVIDIPLLFEAGVNSLFRPVIVCHADYNTRYQRLRARDPKRSRRLTKKMLASQWPVTEKIRLADAIINNTGSFVQLIRQTKALWLKLTSQPDKPA